MRTVTMNVFSQDRIFKTRTFYFPIRDDI